MVHRRVIWENDGQIYYQDQITNPAFDDAALNYGCLNLR